MSILNTFWPRVFDETQDCESAITLVLCCYCLLLLASPLDSTKCQHKTDESKFLLISQNGVSTGRNPSENDAREFIFSAKHVLLI